MSCLDPRVPVQAEPARRWVWTWRASVGPTALGAGPVETRVRRLRAGEPRDFRAFARLMPRQPAPLVLSPAHKLRLLTALVDCVRSLGPAGDSRAASPILVSSNVTFADTLPATLLREDVLIVNGGRPLDLLETAGRREDVAVLVWDTIRCEPLETGGNRVGIVVSAPGPMPGLAAAVAALPIDFRRPRGRAFWTARGAAPRPKAAS